MSNIRGDALRTSARRLEVVWDCGMAPLIVARAPRVVRGRPAADSQAGANAPSGPGYAGSPVLRIAVIAHHVAPIAPAVRRRRRVADLVPGALAGPPRPRGDPLRPARKLGAGSRGTASSSSSPRCRSAARADVSMPPPRFMGAHHAYQRLMLELAGDAPFDVVHSHSLHYLPVALAPLVGAPMLLTLHTPPTPWLESALRTPGAARALAISAVSAATRRLWAPVVDVAEVVPNGVDLAAWPAGPGGAGAAWWGRMVPEKAPHLAIDAARAAGMPLRLAGPIVDREYFDGQVAPRLGDGRRVRRATCGHAELARLVGASRVALMTPVWEEPFGLAAAEAIATGTPVAAFARGGLLDVVGPRGRPPRARRATSRRWRGRCTRRPRSRAPAVRAFAERDARHRRDGPRLRGAVSPGRRRAAPSASSPHDDRLVRPPPRRAATCTGCSRVGAAPRRRVVGLSSLPAPDGLGGALAPSCRSTCPAAPGERPDRRRHAALGPARLRRAARADGRDRRVDRRERARASSSSTSRSRSRCSRGCSASRPSSSPSAACATTRPHRRAYAAAAAVVAPWTARDAPRRGRRRPTSALVFAGAISRFDGRAAAAAAPRGRRRAAARRRGRARRSARPTIRAAADADARPPLARRGGAARTRPSPGGRPRRARRRLGSARRAAASWSAPPGGTSSRRSPPPAGRSSACRSRGRSTSRSARARRCAGSARPRCSTPCRRRATGRACWRAAERATRWARWDRLHDGAARRLAASSARGDRCRVRVGVATIQRGRRRPPRARQAARRRRAAPGARRATSSSRWTPEPPRSTARRSCTFRSRRRAAPARRRAQRGDRRARRTLDLAVLLDVDCVPGPRPRRRATRRGGARTAGDGLLAGPVGPARPARPPAPRPVDRRSPRRARARRRPRPVPPPARSSPSRASSCSGRCRSPSAPPCTRGSAASTRATPATAPRTPTTRSARAPPASPLHWVGGAWAYHQHHPISSPPREHLADIVRNARRFRARWGRWPMEGWLARFAAEGLVEWEPGGTTIRRSRQPAATAR